MPQSFTKQADHVSGNSPIPARAGIGLKPKHFAEILDTRPDVGWFEVHPENYLVAGGPMHHYLTRIRESYPLSFHSVGMSLGSVDGVNELHLRRLRALCDRYEPALVSDHLSWNQHGQKFLNDLLPIPYTLAALQVFVANVDHAQNMLGRSIAIENPSTYLALAEAEMDECDFLAELARTSGATILLDINNVHVSATNHRWSARQYLERIPPQLVSELQLAGHKTEATESGSLLIDDHGSEVCAEVWALYEQALRLLGPKPTLIEWDTNVPAWTVLLQEAGKAERYLANVEPRDYP